MKLVSGLWFSVVLAASSFSISSSLAASQRTIWKNQSVPNSEASTDAGSCLKGHIGTHGNFAFLYYKGYFLEDIEAKTIDTRDCFDKNDNVMPIYAVCEITNDDGTITTVSGICNSEEVKTCSAKPQVGNPTLVPDLVKSETSIDWVSPRDPRFQIVRRYRSDTHFVEEFLSGDVRDGFGGVWRLHLDEFVRVGSVGLSAGQYEYTDADGSRLFFDTTTFASSSLRHSVTMSDASQAGITRLRVRSGAGVRKFFAPDGTGFFLLEEIIWPDGYSITVERGSDQRITVVADNKGQRAEFAWSTTATSNYTGPLISGIEIDANYDGVALAPDVSLAYTYQTNNFISYRPMVQEVTISDVANGQTSTQFRYGYTGGVQTYPPKLSSIEDGRTNADGTSVTYANFSYRYSSTDLWMDEVTATQHAGGADRFEFDRLSPTETRITNALGKETILTHSGKGADRRIVSSDGVATSNCLGSTESWNYDSENLVTSKTNKNGAVTTYTRNARGFPTSMVEDSGGANPRTTTTTWHPELRLPLVRETTHLRTTYTYDTDGLLLTRTETDVLVGSPSLGESRVWTYGYSTLASGLKVLTSVDGPGDPAAGVIDIATYSYNADGTLAQETDANGLVTSYTAYDAFGQPTRIQLPDGRIQGFDYDVEGRVVAMTWHPGTSDEQSMTYAYDEAGLLTAYTNTRGNSWTFEYDGARRLISSTNPEGDVASFEHDAMGNVTRTAFSDGASQETFFENAEFDELGRLMKTLGANQQSLELDYDVEDQLIQTSDAAGVTTSQVYDALNRPVSQIDERGLAHFLEYDEADQLTRYSDPRAINTDLTYNGFGDVVSEVSADRGAMSYTYNARGLVTSMTDGRGVQTTYEYDNGGRIVAKRFPAFPAEDQVFTYAGPSSGTTSSIGKLVSITDNAGTTSFAHDPLTGLVSSETRQFGSASYATQFVYDHEDNLEEMTYPSGHKLVISRDGDDRISAMSIDLGRTDPATGLPEAPLSVLSGASYAPKGPLSSFVFGDGATLAQSFDRSYRLTQQTDDLAGSLLRDVGYSWTRRDNLSTVTDLLGLSDTQEFQYSAASMLGSAGGSWGTRNFEYDAVGNRMSLASSSLREIFPTGQTSEATTAQTGDPYWNSVSFLAGFDENYDDESLGNAPSPVEVKGTGVARTATAARIGSYGLSTNIGRTTAYVDYGVQPGVDFGTGDFTIEGFAQSNYNHSQNWHTILGNYTTSNNGSWRIALSDDSNNRVALQVRGQSWVIGTSDRNKGQFHFAVSRNGDVLRLFVNGVMERKVTGWQNVYVGAPKGFRLGRDQRGRDPQWRGHMDEIRITKGVGRYGSDANITVPTSAHPRDASDPNWNDVSFLAGFETGLADESPASMGTPEVVEVTDIGLSSGAAAFGANGLTVNDNDFSRAYLDYGVLDEVNFGTGDFTVEGFARSKDNSGSRWNAILGNYLWEATGSWGFWLTPDSNSRVVFSVGGHPKLYGTTDLNNTQFHFALSRNGDVMRLFVNGQMEAKSSGWANVNIGNNSKSFLIGGKHDGDLQRWEGHVDEVRVTKGVGRYGSDNPIDVPTSAYPRFETIPETNNPETLVALQSQHIPTASSSGVLTEIAGTTLGTEDADRHILVNIAWAGDVQTQIDSVVIAGINATRLHRLNEAASENTELWVAPVPIGTNGEVTVTWNDPVKHRHFTVYSAPLSGTLAASAISATSSGAGYALTNLTIPENGFAIGGTVSRAFQSGERASFSPSGVFPWDTGDQRSNADGSLMQSNAFVKQNDSADPFFTNTQGDAPYYIVTLTYPSTIDPNSFDVDTYSYGAGDNRLALISEASGHQRIFTYDAAGNVIYDNRSGGGYGYTYDAANRMSSFAINGVVQAEYKYNAQGQQVVRRLTQNGQLIHVIHDAYGNRIAEYLYDEVTQTSTLVREYVWMEDMPVAVIEDGEIYFVRTDHIGRPVFATDELGVKVWEASYLPFGGVESSFGANMDLRFPGQWFQSESGLHQNWMRDYDPTTGRYIQGDPLGLVDGPSVYGYALQNPGRFVDPRGEQSTTLGGSGGALGGALVGPTGKFGDGTLGRSFPKAMEELGRLLDPRPLVNTILDICVPDAQEPKPRRGKCTLVGQVQGIESDGPITHCSYACENGSNPTIERKGWIICPSTIDL